MNRLKRKNWTDWKHFRAELVKMDEWDFRLEILAIQRHYSVVYIYFMYTHFTFVQTGRKVQKLQFYYKRIIKHCNFSATFLRNSPIKHFWSHTPLKISAWPFHFSAYWCSRVIRSVGSEQKSTRTLASAESEPFPCEILSLYFHKWLLIIWGYFWGGHIRGGSDGPRWSAVCIKRHTSFIYWTLLVKRWLKKAISRQTPPPPVII